MNMIKNLEKPLVFFDIESTGIDYVKDRIIELYIHKIDVDGTVTEWYSKFNPEQPSRPEAIAKHGIQDSDLLECPKFADKAQEIFNFLDGADLSGFNLIRFDVPMLVEEFLRVQIIWNVSKVRIIDASRIWTNREPRKLENAYNVFCGKKIENAHSAKADTIATVEILVAQLEKYGMDLEQATLDSRYEGEENNIDLTGKLKLNDDKEPIFNFGKYQGVKFEEVLRRDSQYIQWAMYNENFSRQTRLAIHLLKKKYTAVEI